MVTRDRQRENQVVIMSNKQRELFALIKSLHSVSVYFWWKSQAPTVSEERNEVRLRDIFVIDRFFFRLMCTLCRQILHGAVIRQTPAKQSK